MDLSCALSAILFFIGNILYVIYDALEIEGAQHHTKIGFLELDPYYIKDLWRRRRAYQSLEMWAGMINACAWVLFAIPMLQLAWILSLGGKRRIAMHAAIVILVVGACFTEALSLLFTVGIAGVTQWMTVTMNLSNWSADSPMTQDNTGWRVLEICTLMFSGMTLWVETVEWLALSGVLLTIYMSTRSLATDVGEGQLSFTFGRFWAHLGLFIGILSFFDFVSQVLRIIQWQLFTDIGLLLGIVNRLILFPVWLCCLGKQLTVAANSIEITKNFNKLEAGDLS